MKRYILRKSDNNLWVIVQLSNNLEIEIDNRLQDYLTYLTSTMNLEETDNELAVFNITLFGTGNLLKCIWFDLYSND